MAGFVGGSVSGGPVVPYSSGRAMMRFIRDTVEVPDLILAQERLARFRCEGRAHEHLTLPATSSGTYVSLPCRKVELPALAMRVIATMGAEVLRVGPLQLQPAFWHAPCSTETSTDSMTPKGRHDDFNADHLLLALQSVAGRERLAGVA